MPMDNNDDDDNNNMTQRNVKYKIQRIAHALHYIFMYCLILPLLSGTFDKV